MEKLEYIVPVLEVDYLEGLAVLVTETSFKKDQDETEPDIDS